MGFNYPYCGCADVEAFVAAQHEGATQQLALFVKFVSRPPYLPALRDHNWAAFAKAYNGPGYAHEQVRQQARRRHKRWSAELRSRQPRQVRRSGRRQDRPQRPGHGIATRVAKTSQRSARSAARTCAGATYVPTRSTCATGNTGPTSPIAPRDTLLPNDPAATKQQAQSNACTGFALVRGDRIPARSRPAPGRGDVGLHALQHGAALRRVVRGGRKQRQRLLAARRA